MNALEEIGQPENRKLELKRSPAPRLSSVNPLEVDGVLRNRLVANGKER